MELLSNTVMSEKISDLLLATIKDLKDDIRHLDGKFDSMHKILTENTIVLEEHEKRSTTSEKRLDILEAKQADLDTRTNRLKGFFIYSGLIITALGSLAAAYHNLIAPFLLKK